MKFETKYKGGSNSYVKLEDGESEEGWFAGGHHGSHPMGYTALCTLTLLKCGISDKDKAVKKAFKYLNKLEPFDTYSVACMLMAYEARYYNKKDIEKYLKKKKKAEETSSYIEPFKPRVKSKDKKRLKELTDFLCDAQLSDGSWSYEKPPSKVRTSSPCWPM